MNRLESPGFSRGEDVNLPGQVIVLRDGQVTVERTSNLGR